MSWPSLLWSYAVGLLWCHLGCLELKGRVDTEGVVRGWLKDSDKLNLESCHATGQKEKILATLRISAGQLVKSLSASDYQITKCAEQSHYLV